MSSRGDPSNTGDTLVAKVEENSSCSENTFLANITGDSKAVMASKNYSCIGRKVLCF